VRATASGRSGTTTILSLAPPSPERVHVIELSSFQIDLTPSLAPTIGVARQYASSTPTIACAAPVTSRSLMAA
jgi:hypothetical protein